MSTTEKTEKDANAKADDGLLLQALRELPTHAVSSPLSSRAQAQARAAFLNAFEDEPWHVRFFGTAGRAVVPVGLASVVGLYLFWAFAVAISLNQ